MPLGCHSVSLSTKDHADDQRYPREAHTTEPAPAVRASSTGGGMSSVPDPLPGTGDPLPIDVQGLYVGSATARRDYAAATLHDPRRADEVCHQVYLYIAAHWAELRYERDFNAELWEILRAAIDYENRRSTRGGSGPSFYGRMNFGHAMVALRGLFGEGDAAERAIAQLPARQFDVTVLKHWGDLSRTDIAWLLGLDPATVDYHYRCARSALKERLSAPDRLEDRA